jgi:small subunit ribosomal protein S20
VANIKSQIKRNKQNEKARLRNKAVKSELKTEIRKFREAAESGDVDAANAQLRMQGRHPQEPGRQPQVGDRQARRRPAGQVRFQGSLTPRPNGRGVVVLFEQSTQGLSQPRCRLRDGRGL